MSLAVLDGAHLDPVRPERDDLAVLRADDLAGQREDRGQVGGDAGEALPDAHHHAGAFLEGVELVVVGAPDDEGIIALQVAVGEADGVDELVAAVDVALDGMHAGLAVVLRADGHALGDELLAQLDVVDHVAVVRADHVAVGIEVRLGVDLRRFAEGRPAQLGDAALTAHLGDVVFRGDRVHLADVLAQVDLPVVEGRRADRVVAAVGEALCRRDQDGSERFFFICNVAENSTHGMVLLLVICHCWNLALRGGGACASVAKSNDRRRSIAVDGRSPSLLAMTQ